MTTTAEIRERVQAEMSRNPDVDTEVYRRVADNVDLVGTWLVAIGRDEYEDDMVAEGVAGLLRASVAYRGDTFRTYASRTVERAMRSAAYALDETERKTYPRTAPLPESYEDEPEDGGDAKRAAYTDAEARPIVGQYTSQAAHGHEDRVLAKIDRDRQRADTQWLTRRFLRLLTERQREAIVLVYGLHGFDKHTHAQAAERLGRSRSSVTETVNRALARMRAAL